MLTVHPADLAPDQAAQAVQTHGLGVLHDCLRAEITDRLNGDRALQLEAPYTEKNADLLIADRLICYDGQLYRITRPRRVQRRGIRTTSVEAPHLIYDLAHSYITNIETKEDPAYPDGITAQQALAQVLAGSSFTVGTVDVEEKLEYLEILKMSRLDALKQIMEKWGGELHADNWTVSLLAQRGADRGFTIRDGKNVDGIDCAEDISGVVTRLHVLGYQDVDFAAINGGKDYLDSPAISKYAYVREKYLQLDDEVEPQRLKELGQKELDGMDKPVLNISVDMPRVRGSAEYAHYSDLERVETGDTVTVYHEFLGQNIRVRATETTVDCLTGTVERVALDSVQTGGIFKGFSDFIRVAEKIKAIIDTGGHVRGNKLRGMIDLLTTRLIASGSYQNARVIDGQGALFENNEQSSPDFGALYIGPGILAISNIKDAEGKWVWRTFGTGRGLYGSEIVGGTITGDKMEAGTITTREISAEVLENAANNATGQQLVVTFSRGAILDAENTQTVATVHLYHQGVEITDRLPAGAVSWERISSDAAGDAAWNAEPLHKSVKSVTINAADIDWRGVLRCHIDETKLYSVPQYDPATGHLTMRDFGTGDADHFTLTDGHLMYGGPNTYVQRDGRLYSDMVIGEFILDTQLSNLHTSYISLLRQGIEVYGSGYLRLLTGGKLELRAGSDMDIKAGAGFNLRAGSGTRHVLISNNRADHVTDMRGGENTTSAPYVVWDDGTVKMTKLMLGESQITDVTVPLLRDFVGSADATHTAYMELYIDDDVVRVKKALLSFWARPMRANVKGAAAGGGATSSAGGGCTSSSGGGGTYTSYDNSDGTSTGGCSPDYTGLAIESGGSHKHTMSDHDHYIGPHRHRVAIGSHTHDIPNHTHTVPDHTHGQIYGIYEGPMATQLSVYVDNSFVGTYGSDGANNLNVAAHLAQQNGTIRKGRHYVEIAVNGNTDVVAHLYVKAVLGAQT